MKWWDCLQTTLQECRYLTVQRTSTCRGLLILTKTLWIGYALRINKKIPVISRIGQNTLVIYLLHGFIIKLLEHFNIFEKYQVNLVFILLFAISIVLLLGNVVFEYFSKYILYGGIFKTKKNE